MATKQTTLPEPDRGESNPTRSMRIVLSACPDATDPHPGLWADLASWFVDDRVDSIDRGWDCASEIINCGSPAIYGSTPDPMDYCVYCFGSDIDDVLDDVRWAATVNSDIHAKQIVIPSLTSLGTSLGEIADRLDALAGIGATITICSDEDMHLRPGSGELREVIRAYRAAGRAGVQLQREATKQDIRQWSGIDKEGGRAGLGFDWVDVDGDTEWVPADNYDRICALLEMVRDGELSKRQCAATLNVSPRTITRCIEERSERYGL